MSVDPLSGVQTFHDHDESTGVMHLQRVQDVEPILERNKALQKTDHQSNGIKKSWMHAATVPNIIIEKWINEYGVNFYNRDHWPAVKRLLNSPEWRYLRTGNARL